MANGSIESKGESNVWPADDSAQTQPSSRHHQASGTPGDPNNSPQAANHLPPLPHPRPPSPVSVAELQERAVQDSQNNNVDENSNDRHYDQYAAAAAYPSRETSFHPAYPSQEASHFAYHNQDFSSYPAYLNQETSCPSYSSREASSHLNRETSSQSREASHNSHTSQEARSFHQNRETTHHPFPAQEAPSHHFYSSHSNQNVSYPGHPSHSGCEAALHPDRSVRPRVRQLPQHHRDEPDRVPLSHQPATTRRDSDGSSNWQHNRLKHRRNHCDGTTRYPPLPNLNHPSDESGELPRHLPGYGTGSHGQHSSQELLPRTLGGSNWNPSPHLAVRSTERVTQEAEELLTTFTSETLRSNRLEVPQWMLAVPAALRWFKLAGSCVFWLMPSHVQLSDGRCRSWQNQ